MFCKSVKLFIVLFFVLIGAIFLTTKVSAINTFSSFKTLGDNVCRSYQDVCWTPQLTASCTVPDGVCLLDPGCIKDTTGFDCCQNIGFNYCVNNFYVADEPAPACVYFPDESKGFVCASGQFANLKVNPINGPTTVAVGATVIFSSSIQNTGFADAPASVADWYENRGDGILYSYAAEDTPALLAGATSPTSTYTWTATQVGSYRIDHNADVFQNKVYESLEKPDNSESYSITVVVAPTTTPTPIPPTPTPTPTPACSLIDADGLGWNETCTGLNGPIKDYCNTSSSYAYSNCNIITGCYYISPTECLAGQLCRVKSNGEPECYIPPTPTPTAIPTPTPIPCENKGGTYFCTASSCDAFGASCLQSTLVTCSNVSLNCCYNDCLVPTPTAGPTPTPTAGPTPTPPPTVTIQGRHVNASGNPLTVNIGQGITISGPTGAADNISLGSWYFNKLPTGTYTVTANLLPGYTISYSYSGEGISPPVAPYVLGNVVSNVALLTGGNYADIYFKYVPIACSVATTPTAGLNLAVGGTGTINASVTSGLNGIGITQMRFGSYNTSIATVNPASDPTSDPYSTTVTAVAGGLTAVWGTADLADKRTCETTGGTDTDINVSGPTPTPTPTLLTNGETCNNNAQCASNYCDPVTNTCQNAPTPTPTPTGAPTPTPTPSPKGYIGGRVFIDTNEDGIWQSGIEGEWLTEAIVSIIDTGTGSSYNVPVLQEWNEDGSPNAVYWSFIFPFGTTYSVSYKNPRLGYAFTTASLFSGTVPCSVQPVPPSFFCGGPGEDTWGINFGIAPAHSISGKIFEDINEDKKSTGESNYTKAITITLVNNATGVSYPVTKDISGNYTTDIAGVKKLPSGQYSIKFSGLQTVPVKYRFTYPTTPFNTLIVNVGTNPALPCSWAGSLEASCPSGSIINLNIGVTPNVVSWFQSVGGDMRWDAGFTNVIPSTAIGGAYASVPSVGGMPGIIFAGGKGFPSDFGTGGSPSQNPPFGWIVGSFTYPEIFKSTRSLVSSSYRYLLETVNYSEINKKGVSNLCTTNDSYNCILDPSLTHGLYWIIGAGGIDADLNLNGAGYTFPVPEGSRDYVILVKGNLNINEEIHVPVGTTVIFSATGNITVNKNIGTAIVTDSTTTPIEGFYSADHDFIIEGINDCSIGPDKRLNIGGTVVANAWRIGGTFINNRNLCVNNQNYPSVVFIQRPDFLLNYPNLVSQIPRSWREEKP